MNQYKLGRNYSLVITTEQKTLQITLPFTVEFDITRNTLTSANVCQIRIYNLSVENRNLLRRNATAYGTPFESIVLRAGYGNASSGNNLPIIFSGNISQAWSVREGVNFITQIECYDGGDAFINGKTELSVPAGTPYNIVIGNLIKSLPNIKLGAVGNFPGSSKRANAYSGNTANILRELTGGGFFIDNGVGHALGNNEFTGSLNSSFVINASTGLLNTPVLENGIVRYDMVFEPTLSPGSAITLMSSTESNFNGFYKITAVKHRGVISNNVSGDAITTGEFFFLKDPIRVASATGG